MYRKGNCSLEEQCGLRTKETSKIRNDRRKKMLSQRREMDGIEINENIVLVSGFNEGQLARLNEEINSSIPEVVFNAVHLLCIIVKKVTRNPDEGEATVKYMFDNHFFEKLLELIRMDIPMLPKSDILLIIANITGISRFKAITPLLEMNITQVLLPLLTDMTFCRDVLWVYSNLICDNIMARDDVFNLTMPILLPMVQNGCFKQNTKELLWLFSNFCSTTPMINFELFRPCFNYLVNALQSNDTLTIVEVLDCFSHLLKDEVVYDIIIKQVVPFLSIGMKERSQDVVMAALNAIGIACSIKDEPIDYFVKEGVFECCSVVISQADEKTKENVMWCISNVLSGKETCAAQVFVDMKFPQMIVNEILQSTKRSYTRECGFCLINAIITLKESHVAKLMRTKDICLALDILLRLKHKNKGDKNTMLHWLLRAIKVILIVGEEYKIDNENVYGVMMEDCSIFSALELLEDDCDTSLDNAETSRQIVEMFGIKKSNCNDLSEDPIENEYKGQSQSSSDPDSRMEEN